MALTQRLELRQSQSLVMTPQLQQAIKLLQLSSMELAAYVERELERNPLLERDEGTEGEESDRAEADAPAGKAAVELPDSLDLTKAESLPANAEAPLDTDLENLYDSGPGDAWAASAARWRGWRGPTACGWSRRAARQGRGPTTSRASMSSTRLPSSTTCWALTLPLQRNCCGRHTIHNTISGFRSSPSA